MAKKSDEFIAFEGLLDKLITVPKTAVAERHKAHIEKARKARAAHPHHHPGRRPNAPKR